MNYQLTIFDALAALEPPEPGVMVAGEVLLTRKPVRGQFVRLSVSGEWIVRDSRGDLRMLDKTSCEVIAPPEVEAASPLETPSESSSRAPVVIPGDSVSYELSGGRRVSGRFVRVSDKGLWILRMPGGGVRAISPERCHVGGYGHGA